MKSIPYYEIIMIRKKENPQPKIITNNDLPKGFNFSFYKTGNEKDWANIEYLAGEFETQEDGLKRFEDDFLLYPKEIEKRCVFIENEKNEKIATGTAWWDLDNSIKVPRLEWIAVIPKYQGLGLGKNMIMYINRLLYDIYGEKDFFLKTQTTSYKAVNIYKSIGYEIYKKPFGIYKNKDYEKAIKILEKLI